MRAGVEIRPYEESDLEAIVEFSLRAWDPVFDSLRQVLGGAIFERLHQPEWASVQAEAVREGSTTKKGRWPRRGGPVKVDEQSARRPR